MCPELKILEKWFMKTIQDTIVLRTTRNRPEILTFVKYFSKIFDSFFILYPIRSSILLDSTNHFIVSEVCLS